MAPHDPPAIIAAPSASRGTITPNPGAYFVTIRTHDHACLFGEVVDEEMWLNDAGPIGNDPLACEIWKMFQNNDRQHPDGGSP
ncbi:hypothetical protein HRbin16_00752 [bacterium HR16]|nr:hypothetical protein HRbin16_00752 [bacterium HR16]